MLQYSLLEWNAIELKWSAAVLKWSAAEFWWNASVISLYLFDGHRFLNVERGLLLLYFNILNTTIFSFEVKCYGVKMKYCRVEMKCCRVEMKCCRVEIEMLHSQFFTFLMVLYFKRQIESLLLLYFNISNTTIFSFWGEMLQSWNEVLQSRNEVL